MKGDFSRWTAPNAAARGYAGVLMQQGRLHTDADWNEQVALTARRTETALADIIGRTGAPKEGGGFAISPAAPPAGFGISGGTFYLDGVLIENPEDTTYADQAAPVVPEDMTEVLGNGEEGLFYLEAWKEHVTALDDPRLLEPALGGPDTATRVAIRWRVGVMPVPQAFTGEGREDAIAAARKGDPPQLAAWAPGTGALIADTAPADELEDDADCLIPPEAGYLSQENQLYRIEIVRGGPRGQARFVWSRENGAVVAALAQNEDGAFVLQGDREDEALGFVSGGWVQVYDAADRFRGEAGTLTRMTLTDGVATFSPGIPAFEDMVEPRVRRWENATGAPATGLQLRTTPTLLERGVRVRFTDGAYRVGDYWVIPARAATGTIDWPPYPTEPETPIPAFGWGRRFAPLALARRSGQGIANVIDLRALFPRLTCIEASDVYYDDTHCELGAETVQEALDALCHRNRGRCTFVAHDAASLRAGVARLNPGDHAHICLAAGNFQLNETLRIDGLGHLTIEGAGPQSLLSVGGDEAALIVENCASVRLADFAANGGRVGSSGRNAGRLGAVTVRDCRDVAVERVNASCRAGPWRHASCIAVYGLNRSGPVRVRDCRLTVGQGQTGVQIIAADRALVENCRILPAFAPENVVVDRLRADGALVARIARSMVNLSAETPDAGADDRPRRDRPIRPGARGRAGNVTGISDTVTVGLRSGRQARLNVHPLVANAVGAYFERAGRLALRDEPAARAHIVNVARTAIRNDGRVTVEGSVLNAFRAYVQRIPRETFFFEGVVIAGPRVEEAQVIGNEIRGAQNGVRIAASASNDPDPPDWRSREPRNVVVRAVVERNRIELNPPAPGLPGHGIYAGHVRALEISGNDVRGPANAGRDTLWFGARSHGYRGPLLTVSRNALANVSTGVSVMPDLNDAVPFHGQWFVGPNGFDGVATRHELAGGVILMS